MSSMFTKLLIAMRSGSLRWSQIYKLVMSYYVSQLWTPNWGRVGF